MRKFFFQRLPVQLPASFTLQKVSEAMFKELKLVKDTAIDKDAMLKYIDTNVKEANWKPIMKTAVEECHKEITATKDEIVKQLAGAPFNINKDQCNVIFMSMITCVHLEGFEVEIFPEN